MERGQLGATDGAVTADFGGRSFSMFMQGSADLLPHRRHRGEKELKWRCRRLIGTARPRLGKARE